MAYTVMAYTVSAYIGVTCIVAADGCYYIVTAFIRMAYIVTAYIVMVYMLMACMVMANIVMACAVMVVYSYGRYSYSDGNQESVTALKQQLSNERHRADDADAALQLMIQSCRRNEELLRKAEAALSTDQQVFDNGVM